MIAEFFYPKELKDIIADLRAKDDLDNEALEKMDAFIYKRLAVYVFTGVFFIFLGLVVARTDITIAIIIFLIGIFLSIHAFYSQAISLLKQYPFLYLMNNITSGECLNFYKHGLYGAVAAWRVKYKYKINGIEYIGITEKITVGRWTTRFKKGDEIVVFYDAQNPERSVPFTPPLYSIFNLKKIAKV